MDSFRALVLLLVVRRLGYQRLNYHATHLREYLVKVLVKRRVQFLINVVLLLLLLRFTPACTELQLVLQREERSIVGR